MASMYLEQDHFVWYQWLYERKNDPIVSWYDFWGITHYGDITSNMLCSQLVKLCEKGSIIEHIQQFQKSSLRIKNIVRIIC